jgi:hypothetical protein
VKLTLDEHVPSGVARQLRARGHDVITAIDLFSGRDRGDEILLAAALAAGRAIVTSMWRISSTCIGQRWSAAGGTPASSSSRSGGFRPPRAIGHQIDALDALLMAHPGNGELASQCIWLESPADR